MKTFKEYINEDTNFGYHELNEHQKNALDEWVYGDYDDISNHLRKPSDNIPDAAKHIPHLKSIFDKVEPTTEDKTLYRGVTFKQKHLNRLKEGGTFTDPSFMATTPNKEAAKGFTDYDAPSDDHKVLFHINTPKGSKPLDISKVYKGREDPANLVGDESEHLFKPDSHFRVDSYSRGKDAEGIHHVHITHIPGEI